MKTRTQSILSMIKIVALIGYIGAIISTARVIIPFIGIHVADLLRRFSDVNVTFTFNTGTGLDHLKNNHDIFPYLALMSLVIAIAVLKIQVWEKLRNILQEINLHSPFSKKVAALIENMSYTILGLGIVYFAADSYAHHLAKHITGIDGGMFNSNFQYLFSAGVVYVMAQIFKRGVELQEENELTV
ncbi:DUF2975 domain-containing protein [Emticicia sp. TH156]|uniref:DUF2975 domain-containing protein n=1 Tax=Emticicia sp. TH156 TaxID=2067454 RepID=UPI000C793AC9|nr:DUF2975 domain-containing protein [Emticicia sp. TH156]PLK43503.1 hypothetical protein C0V77_16515 [Emticicia sp. TH156]